MDTGRGLGPSTPRSGPARPGALFEFDAVSLRRDGTDILRSVTVVLPDRGVTVVIGASGAGKSSLLRCCNRLEAPTSGTIRFAGGDLAATDPLAHRRRCGMVFQAPVPFPGSVLDNLRVAAPALSESAADALLERAGLDPALRDREADALSGGEAQRMVLARALATEPAVLLADEATSALDASATIRLEDLASSLAQDGMPVIWVTHDLAQMRRLADHLVVMAHGTVSWTGDPCGEGADDAITDALDRGARER